jgi:hypothetical protein
MNNQSSLRQGEEGFWKPHSAHGKSLAACASYYHGWSSESAAHPWTSHTSSSRFQAAAMSPASGWL